MWIFYLKVFFMLYSAKITVSHECYTCENIDDPDNCYNITESGNGKSCFAMSHTSGLSKTFTLGITDNQNCGTIPNDTSPIVKRDADQKCFECCSKDKCNNRLCRHLEPSTCIDDADIDCARMNKMFNICLHVNQSKNVCPKFCRLCSLVDGNWAAWSMWSSCDVTCDGGIHTRRRTCTDPPPAYHGMQCFGNDTDTKPCDNISCPVNGGWTEWSEWGTCSVTCDDGLKKRNRSCSNPYPSRSGNHCFGDSTDVEMCMPEPCNKTTTTPIVAFKAQLVTDRSLSNNKTIVFSQNIINLGYAYNRTSGIFVAPVAGIYLFTAQVCLTANTNAYFGITAEGNIISGALLGEREWLKCYTMDAIFAVSVGDEISVKCTTACDSHDKLWNFPPYASNTFSGVLIQSYSA